MCAWSRLFHVKMRHGDENVHGDGCPHVGSELACQRAVEHNDLKIMRFWCDAWMNAIDSVNYPVPLVFLYSVLEIIFMFILKNAILISAVLFRKVRVHNRTASSLRSCFRSYEHCSN